MHSLHPAALSMGERWPNQGESPEQEMVVYNGYVAFSMFLLGISLVS